LAGKDRIIDTTAIPRDQVFATIDEIRRYNPQRHEMEQLTAITYVDHDQHICVGYKDVGPDEFWVRGHMPSVPLMPGVVMCEVAAQLSSYYTQRFDLLGAKVVGFGGLEARFRDPVIPGERLDMACQMERLRRGRIIICRFQGFVGPRMVIEGRIMGIPLPVDALAMAGGREQGDGTTSAAQD
jgi:3-hydroxyacyl-[acyl-carrier-protein] dehydratase